MTLRCAVQFDKRADDLAADRAELADLDALSRTRALSDAESIRLEKLICAVDKPAALYAKVRKDHAAVSLVINRIIDRAAKHAKCTSGEIKGTSQDKRLCRLRAAISYEAARRDIGVTAIARSLGHRNHTTIISAIRRAQHLKAEPGFVDTLKILEAA